MENKKTKMEQKFEYHERSENKTRVLSFAQASVRKFVNKTISI